MRGSGSDESLLVLLIDATGCDFVQSRLVVRSRIVHPMRLAARPTDRHGGATST